MKKVLPLFMLAGVAGLLFSTCKKNNNEETQCKVCEARGGDGQLIKEETVCSESEESIFRSKYDGSVIKCN